MSAPAAETGDDWRTMALSALAFWEPARIVYNAVLAATAWLWLGGLEGAAKIPAVDWLVGAAVANLVYTGVYPVDLILQAKGDRSWRPTQWLAGTFVVWTVLNLIFWLMRVFGKMVTST